ncbi:hypothetical protein OAO01_04070 [Oligoflexia bacterium]|nr:hypothetical protein [Oligoflexia bacterium]
MKLNINEVEIRATSPDNDLVIRDIISLFHEAYGDTYPVQSIYQQQFWKSHVGSRFTSLVAVHNEEVIAHLAASKDSQSEYHFQICFPVCKPDLVDHIPALGKKAWEVFTRQGKRQDWQMIYYFTFNNVPAFQQLADNVLHTQEVAICPSYFPATNFRTRGLKSQQSFLTDHRTNIVVTQRVFPRTGEHKRTLFVPHYHEAICKELYSTLPLVREFEGSLLQDASIPLVSAVGASAIQRACFTQTGTCHAFVQPSLVENHEAAVCDIDTSRAISSFVLVNLEDHSCPSFCHILEEHGYRFCGVFPLLRDHDRIMYFKGKELNHPVETYQSARAQMLADYMESYTVLNTKAAIPLADQLPALDEIDGAGGNGKAQSAQPKLDLEECA